MIEKTLREALDASPVPVRKSAKCWIEAWRGVRMRGGIECGVTSNRCRQLRGPGVEYRRGKNTGTEGMPQSVYGGGAEGVVVRMEPSSGLPPEAEIRATKPEIEMRGPMT